MNIKNIREGAYRAGFRSISKTVHTLIAAIERLRTDGHLGSRKCLIVSNRFGRFAVLVHKGGVVRRVWQGANTGARVTKGLGQKKDSFAWLEVPAGMVSKAREIVIALAGSEGDA